MFCEYADSTAAAAPCITDHCTALVLASAVQSTALAPLWVLLLVVDVIAGYYLGGAGAACTYVYIYIPTVYCTVPCSIKKRLLFLLKGELHV